MARQTNNSQAVNMDIPTSPSSTGTTSPSTTKKAPAAKKTPVKKTSKSPPKEIKPGTAVRVKRKRGRKNGDDDEEEEQLTGKAYWAKILGPGLYGAKDSDDDNDGDEKAPPAKRARTATPPAPEPVKKAGEVFSVDENQPLAATEPEKAATPQPTPLPTPNPGTPVTPHKHDGGGEITFPVHLPTPTSLPRKEVTAQTSTEQSPVGVSTEPNPTTSTTNKATKQVKKPAAKPRAPRKPKAEPLVKPKPKAPPKPRAPRKPKEPKEPKQPKPKAPRKPRAPKDQGKGKGKGKQATTTTTHPPGIPANAKEVSPGQWDVTLTGEEEAAFLADPMAEGIIVEYDEKVEWRYDTDPPIPSVDGGAASEDPEGEVGVGVEVVDIRPAPRRTNVIPNVVEKLRKAKAEFRGQMEEVERIEPTWWCKWKDLGNSESEDGEDDDIIE